MESDDLATVMTPWTEAQLLKILQERYSRDKIYTYVSDTLITLNPFGKTLQDYGKDASKRYNLAKPSANPPHVFAVADRARQAVLQQFGTPVQKQCIVLRGESASGKTETGRLLLRQLMRPSSDTPTQIQQQILQILPLLEAFGNAPTSTNENSSRFGSYIHLHFYNGQVVGARVSEYMMEKSRVTRQQQGEGNFHIFYNILASGGGPPKEYRYLSDKKICNKYISNIGKSKYEAVINALIGVGFTDQEQVDILCILSAILSIGNINVEKSSFGEAVFDDRTKSLIQDIAELVGLDGCELEECLCAENKIVYGEQIRRSYTRDESEDYRDVIARAMYGRLFGWIVYKINTLLVPTQDLGSTGDTQEIGILDMCSYESLDQNNNFEQLCRNVIQEQLYNYFTKSIACLSHEECIADGIEWNNIAFTDNLDIIDVYLSKPNGLLAVLDQHTQSQTADETLLEKLNSSLAGNSHFVGDKAHRSTKFIINHHDGRQVTYDGRGWSIRNHDAVPLAVTAMMQRAENATLGRIFAAKLSKTAALVPCQHRQTLRKNPLPTQRILTASTYLRNSLEVIMEQLSSSQPLFVYCIRPNRTNSELIFDDKYVLTQVKAAGLLEMLAIYQGAFFSAIPFADFVSGYQLLVRDKVEPSREGCRHILEALKFTDYQIGNSAVFLKYQHCLSLEELIAKAPKQTVNAPQRVGVRPAEGTATRKTPTQEPPPGARLYPRLPTFINGSMRFPGDASIRIKLNVVKKVPSKDDSSSESDFELLEDDLRQVRTVTDVSAYGPVGSRQASIAWFKSTQAATLRQANGVYDEWFHGIITRKDAEKLLSKKPVGCYLIRVGETRIGYTLSFRDDTRCRHYMIEQLPEGEFFVTGENQLHSSLNNLIAYYKQNKLTNWPKTLTIPCGQAEGECNYEDLILNQDEQQQLNYIMSKPRQEASAPPIYGVQQQPTPASGDAKTVGASQFYTATPLYNANQPRSGLPSSQGSRMPSTLHNLFSKGPQLPHQTSAAGTSISSPVGGQNRLPSQGTTVPSEDWTASENCPIYEEAYPVALGMQTDPKPGQQNKNITPVRQVIPAVASNTTPPPLPGRRPLMNEQSSTQRPLGNEQTEGPPLPARRPGNSGATLSALNTKH